MLVRSSFRGLGPDTGATVPTSRLQFKDIPEEIAFLRQMIDVYRETPWARETAIRIIRAACPPKDKLCQAIAIAEAVQRRIYYVNEYPEVFQSPPRTWDMRAGDCDDQTTLTGTLLEAIGIPVEVVGLKMDGEWKHVFARALVQIPGHGEREVPIALDTTLSTPVRRLTAPEVLAASHGKKVQTLTIP